MEITVLGSGTSNGIPEPGCFCPVCLSDDPRDNRTRSSILITSSSGYRLLIDTATEFRLQAVREKLTGIEAVCLTHSHSDHIQGLDDLRNFSWKKSIPIYGNDQTLNEVRERYGYLFKETQKGGGKPQVSLIPITGTFKTGDFEVTPLPLLHGKLPINGYRCGNFLYMTDCSSIPESTWPLLKNPEVMIIDGLRYRPHETHFSISQAVEVIQKLSPRVAYLTHFCHDISHKQLEKELPQGVFPAYDGLKIHISRE